MPSSEARVSPKLAASWLDMAQHDPSCMRRGDDLREGDVDELLGQGVVQWAIRVLELSRQLVARIDNGRRTVFERANR